MVTYRADHVGSLLRPPELVSARKNPDSTQEQLTELENRYILRVLERQQEAGLRIFTDGEFRRGGFMGDFYDSVEGLDQRADIGRAWKATSGPGKMSGTGTLAGVVVE